jgi:hypothetical protein
MTLEQVLAAQGAATIKQDKYRRTNRMSCEFEHLWRSSEQTVHSFLQFYQGFSQKAKRTHVE